MKISDVAGGIINTATAGELKALLTLKTMCNSDSSFVAAVKKYHAFQKLLQKAFLLSRTWLKLGQARTWKITIKSLQAALKAMAAGFKRRDDFMELPYLLRLQIEKIMKSYSVQLSIVM